MRNATQLAAATDCCAASKSARRPHVLLFFLQNKMDADAVADSNSFDVSGTSVAILQGFLDTVAVVTIEEALEILRNYCPDCSPQVAHNTLVANKWEVAQIIIVGFTNEDYKCAIRIFTAEGPFPFYKWINAAFFSKVRRVVRMPSSAFCMASDSRV
jgi:hypothetical protein